MPEHIKIILTSRHPPVSALIRIQGEVHTPFSALESKIAAGEPILDRLPPHNMEEEFLKSTLNLVNALDVAGLDYSAWLNDGSVTPQHLRALLTHKLHVRKNLHGPKVPRSRPSLEDDE